MKIECYAASLTQEGRKTNEDAWILLRGDPLCAALCDGAGDARRAAKRVLQTFEKLFKLANQEEISIFPTWINWVKLLDSSLLGGDQSTFIAISILEGKIVGTCAGDSRLYKISRDGEISIPSEGASKYRLGSGRAQPFPLHIPINNGDIFLLMSDGAWTPLNLYLLKKIVARSATRHFSELASDILQEAGKAGRADDMTVITLKVI
jgi:serine/threonine protein phosphatase PrpC